VRLYSVSAVLSAPGVDFAHQQVDTIASSAAEPYEERACTLDDPFTDIRISETRVRRRRLYVRVYICVRIYGRARIGRRTTYLISAPVFRSRRRRQLFGKYSARPSSVREQRLQYKQRRGPSRSTGDDNATRYL